MEKQVKKELAKFGKTLNDREIQMIQNQRQHNEVYSKDERATKLAALSEDGYKKFKQFKLMVAVSLHKCLSAKRELDKIQIDIQKGNTERKFSDGSTMDVTDLSILQIDIDNKLFGYMSDLANHCLGVYARVGCINPVNKRIFFTKEDWNEYITNIEVLLKKHGLDLYKE